MMISKAIPKMMYLVFACAVFGFLTTEIFAAKTVVSDPAKTDARLKLEEKAKADEEKKPNLISLLSWAFSVTMVTPASKA